MGNRARLLLVQAIVCLWAAPALAQDYGRSGPYLGVNAAFGFGNFYEDAIDDELPISVKVDDSWGLNARAGYRLLSFFAVEAHYEYMDRFRVKLSGQPVVDQSTHTITGNLKFLLPTWRVQPYLMLGAGGQYYEFSNSLGGLIDDNDWAFAARPALGLDIYLTRNLVLNAEGAGVIAVTDIDVAGDSIANLPYVSVSAGLQWRF